MGYLLPNRTGNVQFHQREAAMSDFDYVQLRWIKQFAQLDNQILEEAAVCQVRILDSGVIERVLQNDTLVCAAENPAAFAKTRPLAMIHYSLWDKAVVALGRQGAVGSMSGIRNRLRACYGDSPGGPAARARPAIRRRVRLARAPKSMPGTVAGRPRLPS
jgi:hypothetical protein